MAKKEKKVRIFSALEVANICGVVNQTAINWIKNGHLEAFTTPGGQYRVYAENLLTFLRDRNMKVPEELAAIEAGENQAKEAAKNKLSVLIIDDDHELNGLIKDYLTRKIENINIFQAYDGFEAGKLISLKNPPLVILDIGLPGVDGFKLCHSIKNDPELKKTRVISISGLSSPDDEKKIMDQGADIFFPKPLNYPDLAAAVAELLL